MGEMSQSVSKLRYKGNYSPTEILDHYTDVYIPLTNEVKALIQDNECHCLNYYGYNGINNEYLTKEEVEYYINNIPIDVFGEQVMFEDFLNLYLAEEPNLKNIISYSMRRLMQITDITTFNKFSFYFNLNE